MSGPLEISQGGVLSLLRMPCCVLSVVLAAACSNSGSGSSDSGSPLEPEPESTLSFEWSRALSPSDNDWIVTTWGLSGDSRYAGGGTQEQGRIIHYDGEAWAEAELPEGIALVNWITGFANDDIYAAANEGGLLHFDGEKWSELTVPTDEDLWGIWGAQPDAIWAVGGSGQPTSNPVVLFYDGEEWTETELPELERSNVHAFFKVWGSAKDDVYIVGQNGVVLHFDGDSWSEELAVGASDDLIALWGTGSDNILAVGGRTGAIVSHYNGKEWNTVRLFDSKDRTVPGINGVWMREEGVAHLALVSGYLAKLTLPELKIELYGWKDFLDFHAIHGTADGMLTAVGGNLTTALLTGDYEGLLIERSLEDDE